MIKLRSQILGSSEITKTNEVREAIKKRLSFGHSGTCTIYSCLMQEENVEVPFLEYLYCPVPSLGS